MDNMLVMSDDPIAEFRSLCIDTHYKMDHPKRGLALIFNHEYYEKKYANSRLGTNVDCDLLGKSLTNLGFKVKHYQNLKSREIKGKLKKVSEINHKDHDCLVVAILTHGKEGELYAYDNTYSINAIWSYFNEKNCPSLAEKPKIFFIQACRGARLDEGISLRERTQTDTMNISSIPFLPDFLIVYATASGHYAWRNEERGSWFIQALCSGLNKNGKKLDLLALLTFVNQCVAIDYESRALSETMSEKKQIPCITSMLRRRIQF